MGVARNLHLDWEGSKYIDAYKETYGKNKWNFKIGVPELTELVKDFYKKTFYEKFRTGGVLDCLQQEIIFDWRINGSH